MKWTTEQDDTLRSMWGKSRTTVIAGAIGTTKNAIIGRAHRIGLETLLRAPAGQPRAPRAQREKRVRIGRTFAAKATVIPVPVDALNIPFFQLEPQHCRFPTSGEGSSILFCGNTVTDGNSFCGWHCSIAYEAPKREAPRYHWIETRNKQGQFNYWRAA